MHLAISEVEQKMKVKTKYSKPPKHVPNLLLSHLQCWKIQFSQTFHPSTSLAFLFLDKEEKLGLAHCLQGREGRLFSMLHLPFAKLNPRQTLQSNFPSLLCSPDCCCFFFSPLFKPHMFLNCSHCS